jgi:hypothetical protein
MFGLLVAYCADILFYGGVYSATVLTIGRHIAHGVFMGLMRYA